MRRRRALARRSWTHWSTKLPARGSDVRAGGGRFAIPLALLLASCGLDPSGPPDLILYADRVSTLDSIHYRAQAVAIRSGQVMALGDSAPLAALAGPSTRQVRLGPGVLGPAFIDHHVHLANVGFALLDEAIGGRLFLDLSDATSIEEVARRVAERAAQLDPDEWVLGIGWSQGAWGTQRLPTHEPLSRAAPDRPVFLARIDGHAGWANRRALELAGLWPSAPDPPGGSIPRGGDGTPSGMLLERANEAVTRLVPPLPDSTIRRAFRLAAERLAENGVVEVYDAGVLAFPGVVSLTADLDRYFALLIDEDRASPLPLRINLMVPAPSALADRLLAAGAGAYQPTPRIRVTHLKLFADGALGSRGAALTHPYADDPTTSGVPRLSAAEIESLASRALDAGLGAATHTIGDEATRRALDGYERIVAARPNLDRRRLRIEHFSYAREEDFARAVRLGVVLSVQSNFNSFPDESPTFGAMRVGAENDARVYAWDRLLGMGAELVEGSDYFVRPAGPLAGFEATLVRKGSAGANRPDAAARRLAWILNATLQPPEGPPRPPMLVPGAAADLVLLSADPLTVPRDSLARVEALGTWSAGRQTAGRAARPGPR
ncbi:MAG: amidohydrolase [Gemmatimonadales bacterium]